MTTASALPFSTMEVPADDTMEMASPLQGHADDFEIDIDVIEDQASNPDKDMIGADEYQGDSIDVDYNQDGANDADMMDDVAEPVMVDADGQFPEPNDNAEMQYSAEETYEADMLEDDYDEDIDVPMPKSEEQEQVSATIQEEAAKKVESEMEPPQVTEDAQRDGEKPDAEPHVESREEHAEPKEVPSTDTKQRDRSSLEQEAGVDQNSPERADDKHSEANQADRVEEQDTRPNVSEDGHKDHQEPEENREIQEVQLSVDHTQDQEAEQGQEATQEARSQEVPKEKEQAQEQALEQDVNKHPGLHPVKVYYQDSEISLFPPREGDASETYFVEDENLAYENFGKLFESFRGVLQEHVGENEILVVDIDALNIQLTEDSLHISQVTLCQIVKLYLRLCKNDSLDEPEALYLSLSTRLTIPAAISDLRAAANEGKGLSEIYCSWDDYDEEPLPTDVHTEESKDEPHQESTAERQEHVERVAPTPVEPDISRPEERELLEKEEHVISGEAQKEEPVTSDHAVEQEDDHHVVQPEAPNEAEPGAVERDVNHEQAAQENEAQQSASNEHGEDTALLECENDEYEEGGYGEGEYANETQEYNESVDREEQRTDSTATIAPFPETDEQQDADQTAEPHQPEHGGHEEYQGIEGVGEDNYPEEEANLDALEHTGSPEEPAYNGSDDAYDEADLEQSVDKDHEKRQSESHEPGHGDETAQDSAPTEDVGDEALQGRSLHDELEFNSEDDAADLSHNNTKSTLEPADDLLGIAEDLMGSPTKDAKGVNGGTGDQGHDDSGEALDENGHVLSANSKERDPDDLTFDGENHEYLNLDFDDEVDEPESAVAEAVPHDAVSAKRSREPEDESELTEIPSPDAKRSRSS